MPGIEVSIVIPTHNRRELLSDLLMALSHQTFPAEKFEAIVVVDGSTDGTHEMLKDLRVPYRLRMIDQPQSGVAAARNNGAREAEGDILVFLDDDIVPNARLLDEYLLVQRNGQSGVVLGQLVPGAESERNGWNKYEDYLLRKHYKAVANGARPPAGRRLYSGNFSIRRDIFLRHGGFDEKFGRGEDVELGFRLEQDGVSFSYNGRASVVHRGYRSFDSWRSSARSYGHCEVVLALRRADHNRALAEISNRYHARPPQLRRMIEFFLGRESLRNAFVQTLKHTCGVLNRIGLYKLAHPGYSIIFNIQYWKGVADQLGGKEAFKRCISVRPQARVQARV
ncbi:MAG: glycosyltransferase family 2 protein [Chloroflexi bacterium]|nr:glycosyltransferase family 2 protein [Chloroflexota bacterium]